MSTHIPTPLVFYTGSRSIYDAAGRCLCIVTHSPKNGTREEMVNRGNEIVRCVNERDELIAALRLAYEALQDTIATHVPAAHCDTALDAVTKALVKAEAAS